MLLRPAAAGLGLTRDADWLSCGGYGRTFAHGRAVLPAFASEQGAGVDAHAAQAEAVGIRKADFRAFSEFAQGRTKKTVSDSAGSASVVEDPVDDKADDLGTAIDYDGKVRKPSCFQEPRA